MSYIKHFIIHSPKILQPKRVLVLSDLHIGKNSDEHIKELIKETKNKKDIDLILMPGDIVHSEGYLYSSSFCSGLVSQITDLTRDIPTFISAGNHDQMVRDGFERFHKSNYKQLKELLNTIKNVTFLDNEQREFEGLTIGDFTPSIDYYLTHHEKPHALLNEYKKLSHKVNFNKGSYNILLSHDPISLLKIAHSPRGNLIPRTDLVLSGHTHDGLVPYGLQDKMDRGFISPTYKPLPKYSTGSYKCHNTIYLINGAVNPFVENQMFNNLLGTNYSVVDLEPGPKLTYTRES